MKYFKKLVGDRIYLSPRNSGDAEIFTEWLNDFETTDYIGMSGNLMSLDGEKDFLEKNNNPVAIFVIVTLEDDRMIGTVSLENINRTNRTATLGIFIGDKSYRNNGYGPEAILLILEYGFRYMNLYNIGLDLIECNTRAFKCYERCGFKEYGRRRKCKFINGHYYDCISMDILADEFTGNYIRNTNI